MYDHTGPHPAYCRPLSPLIDPEDPFLFLRLRENVPSYVNEILSALAEDRWDKFMEIVRDKVPEIPEPSCVVTRPLLLNWAIDHRALLCAKSLISLSSIINRHSYGLLPLHRAATEFLPEFVKLFSRVTQLESYPPCDDRRSEYYLMTPLEAVLEKLRKKILWSPTQSVYSLIFGLCGTVEMENACCTISHLVVASGVQTIIDTIYYYSEGGKIIDLAALLYADGISRRGILKGLSNDEYLELRETVATSILSCSKEDNYFAVDGYGVALSFGKKQAMLSILLLLEIFYRTDFSMLGFDTSQEILGKRMQNAGFDCAADGLQYTRNVLASEVKHHKTMDDQPPPVFFSTNPMKTQIIEPRSTSASHFHEKRTLESSKSIVCLPVTGKAEKSWATPEPEYFHHYLYHYHHVIEEVWFPELLEDDDVKSYVKKLFTALRKDKCSRFVKLIKDEMQRATFASFEIAPSLFTWTIFFRAPRCAEAILSGKIGQPVNLNVPPNACQPLPIHLAATRFLPEFVNLFIKYGARLDIPSGHLLPLDACLQKLRRKILWTPAQSVYELVFDLCDNTELEQAYLTISNIMRAMPVKEIQQAICHYVLQQMMVELAILLYVDAISNLGVFEDLSLQYLALRQFAAANILSRSEELLYFLVDGNGLTVSKDKKWAMKSMMLLFEIFRRTDFSMLGFNSGRIDLQNRIRDAGFDLFNLQNPATGVGKYPEAGEYPEEVSKYSEVVSKCPEVRQLEPMADVPRDIISPAIWTSRPKRIQISHQRSVFANTVRGVSSAAQTFPASQSFKLELVPMPFTLVDGKACATKAANERPRLFGSSLKMCSVLAAAIRKALRV